MRAVIPCYTMNDKSPANVPDNIQTFSAGDPLIGKYFHTTLNGRINQQGQIMNRLDDGHYLVDLFSFITGEYCCQRVYAAADMTNWLIYKTQAEMIYSYDQGVACRIKP